MFLKISKLLCVMILMMGLTVAHAIPNPIPTGQAMPDFPSDAVWLNIDDDVTSEIKSETIDWQTLRGNVVLVNFWTFDCWNCYRSFPWLNDLRARYADKNFKVIGVHTPEFGHEKVLANVQQKIIEFELKHPSMIDNDRSYWQAVRNRYWPAFYLVDKQGRFRAYYVGETHKDTPRAQQIEQAIQQLLNE